MRGRRPQLVPVEDLDPVQRLWRELPAPWRGPLIGPGIDNWAAITENGNRTLDLGGLPDPFPAELAWMAHWQSVDGTRSSVLALNQLANILRRAAQNITRFRVRYVSWIGMQPRALQRWFYAHRWGRLPPKGSIARLRVVFRFARLALLARCQPGPWWALDDWQPRCDPRIPLSAREPQANYGCAPGQIGLRWLREAVKWHLGTQLEAGTLRWTTVSQERIRSLHRFDNWLTTTFDDPAAVLGDPSAAAGQAAGFRRWTADPCNRMTRENDRRHYTKPVHPRLINDDIRAVAELFAFAAANQGQMIGHLRGATLAAGHRDTRGQLASSGLPYTPHVDLERSALHRRPGTRADPRRTPTTGLPRDQQMLITRGDGTQVLAPGFDDPQAMRMILLQVLTGRRASEIRTCEFDCLSPAPDRAVQTAADAEVVRFRYAQSKIDIAPDSILVDREVAAVIEEQQQWVRDLPSATTVPGSCSCNAPETGAGTSPTHRGPTTGCCVSSATSSGSPTARGCCCS